VYGKVFTQMFEGTLASKGPWQALVTFQQLIVLANKHGEVDMTADAISRRTTIPLNIITLGLEELQKPDPDSRTEGEEGRRIVRLDKHRTWGWRLVNYAKYCKIRSEEDRREYMRVLMANKRAEEKKPVSNVSSELAMLAHVDVDVDVDVDVKTKPCADPSGPHGSVSSQTDLEAEAVARVWSHYLEKLDKNLKLLSFTAGRKQKGMARLRECLKKTGGNLAGAEGLMRLAVDALAASPYHCGENNQKRRYDSWEDNLFKNQEQLEKWLERA
jgi:hypothetical protein